MRNDFLGELKFDPNDLLDPRVCKGNDLVPNILRTLGANEDVVKNPLLISEIGVQIHGIASQSGISIPNNYVQPTRETINAIVEAIKANGILTIQEIENKYARLGSKEHKRYCGISIDEETGAVTLQTFAMHGREVDTLDINYIRGKTFTPDGKGNAIDNGTSYIIGKDTYKARLEGASERVYNPDGITMRSESRDYEVKEGKNTLVYHVIYERDGQYPFVTKQQTIVNDFGHGTPVGEKYRAIDRKDLSQLGFPEYETENGIATKPVEFANREAISEYYEANKEAIARALMEEPYHGLFPTKTLRKALKAGMGKLAKKAGILPDEHEHGPEIVE